MQRSEVVDWILGEATRDDLRVIVDAYKSRSERLARQAARSFKVGDRVRFVKGSGEVIVGTVDRVNKKTLGVRPDGGGRGWRVPGEMLERGEGE
jgi:hypothetical protein